MRAIRKSDNPWLSHDWKVKTLVSVSRSGSRLGFTCRSCERTFTHVTGDSQTWATNGHDVALAEEVSKRWLSEACPIRPDESDAADRLKFKNPQGGLTT
jgi:hypothetical protein